MMADGSLRERMAKAGRARAVETFSWARIAEEVAALYREVI